MLFADTQPVAVATADASQPVAQLLEMLGGYVASQVTMARLYGTRDELRGGPAAPVRLRPSGTSGRCFGECSRPTSRC
jgi:hypothetical protein